MKSNIKDGIRFTFRVSPALSGGFYAGIIKSKRHTYSKHTAYGVRTVWKAFAHFDLKNGDASKFPDYESATQAAIAWITQRTNNPLTQ